MRGHFTPHSDKTKKLISEKKRDNPTRYWLGKKRSQETKDKISRKKMGTISPKKGIPVSIKEKERLSKLSIGRKTS